MRDTPMSQLPAPFASIAEDDLQQVTGGRLLGGLLANLFKGGGGKGLLGNLLGGLGGGGGGGEAAAAPAPQPVAARGGGGG